MSVTRKVMHDADELELEQGSAAVGEATELAAQARDQSMDAMERHWVMVGDVLRKRLKPTQDENWQTY
ncbi:hypothetical protein JK202_10860 [Gluconobacter sp. Dm-62]|uniref:hypothetical protein n=1 Tax=Gluconobacter sp. Dm-62 TaxID=2799804 RepID=UPI001B8C6D7F|nr:hypothetical protein [Gluconobacter sp. Dm-62]MBS1103509.1 hypothetical protein [Gluconobacter sp. Dm-62]